MQHSSPPGLKRSPDLLLKSLLCLPSFPGPFHSLFLFLGMFLPNLCDKICISSKIYDSQNFLSQDIVSRTSSFNQLRLGFASFTIFLSQLIKLIKFSSQQKCQSQLLSFVKNLSRGEHTTKSHVAPSLSRSSLGAVHYRDAQKWLPKLNN